MVASRRGDSHRISLEDVRPSMAKADLTSVETAHFQSEIGRCVQRAISILGWSNKEAAGEMGIDPAQLSRWIAGTERPQLDRLFRVAALRQPLVIALAALAGADVDTRISFRRSA